MESESHEYLLNNSVGYRAWHQMTNQMSPTRRFDFENAMSMALMAAGPVALTHAVRRQLQLEQRAQAEERRLTEFCSTTGVSRATVDSWINRGVSPDELFSILNMTQQNSQAITNSFQEELVETCSEKHNWRETGF